MSLWRLIKLIFLSAFLVFFATKSFAFPSLAGKKNKVETNSVLKADQIDGDRENGILTATGNVELSKDGQIIYADKAIYNQNDKIISGVGNIKVKNVEIGNMTASRIEMKDDFTSGEFINSTIVLNDGSYLSAPKIERNSPEKTTLYKSFYSICPNDEIAKDNKVAGKKRDMAAISSSSTVIDRKNNMMRSKHGIFRFYNVPFLYTPYIAIPLPAKKRQSGFLYPSYVKTTNFGFGMKIPYHFVIAPNIDLTTSPQVSFDSNQIIVGNEFRHLTNYGKYNLNLELANNELKSNQVNSSVLNNTTSGLSQRTNKSLRWHMNGSGLFDFTENFGLDFNLDTVSDINYLRDYQFNYLAYTTSKVNVDYIRRRDYYSIKTIKFQELQNRNKADQAQIVLPAVDTYTESEKSFFSKEKFALATNLTNISPQSGLQYRRASITPEVKIPFNINGNLFDINAKLQSDFYWLENNFRSGETYTNYDSTFTNYKPEASFTWRLPLIQKSKYNTLILEPIASLVSSSYKRANSKTINEDSNNAELSVSNLFISDRISGFDRNESGERVSYGLKTSSFSSLGEFALTIGQSYRISSSNQDTQISGFADNNKSNLVGQALYRATKYFSIFYTFQLNENNYRNDINQVTTSLAFDRFSISSDYLLLRRNQQNITRAEQVSLNSSLRIVDRWFGTISFNRDLTLKRTISRGLSLRRDGCCTIFGFSVTETNPGSLIKPQRSFSINFTFKNL